MIQSDVDSSKYIVSHLAFKGVSRPKMFYTPVIHLCFHYFYDLCFFAKEYINPLRLRMAVL